MQRFYFDIKFQEKLLIDDKDFFGQVSVVLRSRIGDEIILFNGESYDYIYEIIKISKNGIELTQKSKIKTDTNPKNHIVLYQAIPNKYEKIDYILQKGVETGISKFVFFRAERSSKLVLSDNKISRFKHIIKEALEQSGGNEMPELEIQEKLDLKKIEGKVFVCHFENENSEILEKTDCNICVGPEGGFSKNEINNFKNVGFSFLNFGNRVLRTETISSVLTFRILN